MTMAYIVIIVSIVVQGMVISNLWGLFLVPIFGLPAIGRAGAVGCMALLSIVVMTFQNIDTNKDETMKNLRDEYLVGS